MAGLPNGDQRFSSSQSDPNIRQMLQDAQSRWLKPFEVCEILNHHQQLALSETAPIKPSSGSLFLFDRNKLRYFRKDGHNWRKKKDGKTVREAHEKLKVGNKDAIHCYYAHGEDNLHFQRRSYWLLEGGYEHIVLVHYLEVSQSNRYEASLPSTFQDNQAQYFSHVDPNNNIYGSNPDYFTLSPSEMVSSSQGGPPFDLDSGDELEDKQTTMRRGSQEYQAFPLAGLASTSSIPAIDHVSRLEHNQTVNPYIQGSRKNDTEDCLDWSTLMEGSYGTENNSNSWIGPSAPAKKSYSSTSTYQDNRLQSANGGLMEKSPVSVDTWSLENYSDMGYSASVQNEQEEADASDVFQSTQYAKAHKIEQLSMVRNSYSTNQDVQGIEKGLLLPTLSMVMRSIQSQESSDIEWVDGGQVPPAPTLSNPGTSWADTVGHEVGVSERLNLPGEFSFDAGADSILPQRQRFKIVDFAPEWVYAFEETKVLVTGVFLESARHPDTSLSCVFGEVKVPAEVLESDALRCIAPALPPGKVPFYVANSDGLVCSHVHEFEYRTKSTVLLTNPLKQQGQELLHQIRLARLLLAREDVVSCLEVANGDLTAMQKPCEKIDFLVANQNIWNEIEDLVKSARHPLEDAKAMLMLEFLKSAFHQWLHRQLYGKGVSSSFDKHRVGVFHMVAALGYKWAIAPILAANVGVNSRDEQGWTALHWAAFCGREEVIAQLLAAGAAPGALTDPTPSDLTGRTASDLAASSGHNGIAGYLGEAIVTSHLLSLNLHEGGEMNKASAVATDVAVEIVSEKSLVQASLGLTQDELSLRDSLAAVRNASQAEARITATFRAYSFLRRKGLEEASIDEYGMLDEEAQAFAAMQRAHPGHHEKTNLAATQIQCKYRGWKARSEFLNLKNHVVKIQAHVRGHQARKKYKKIVWTVSMLDKVILRWRRKGSGLRGFKAETMEVEDNDDDLYMKEFRKLKEAAFGEAVSRVKQMIQNPEARCQYRRMLEIYQKEKGVQCERDMVIPDDDELIGLLG